ncbi:General substrate transporter [Rhypophila sp. PSN 637]
MPISTQRNTHLLANYKCILICAAMALASCQYGFDSAAIAGFQAMPGFLRVFGYYDPNLSPSSSSGNTTTGGGGWAVETRTQQLISSTLNIGAILGVCLTGLFARYFGRRAGIWTACLISFTSCGIQIGTTSVGALCVGRILLGMSNAFFFTFCNVYSVESTPAHLRAVVSSLFSIWVSFGSLLGAIVNETTAGMVESRLSYQIPLATLYVVPGTLCILVLFVPESPRWLLVKNRVEKAEESLRRLRGKTLKEEFLVEEFVEMQKGIEEEKTVAEGAAFWDMFRGSNLRRTIITLGVVVSHSSSGLWLFIAYSTYFFQQARIKDSFQMSVFFQLAAILGTAMGMYLMYKHMGRRSMMLTGSALSGLCMMGSALADTIKPKSVESSKAIAGFSIAYIFLSMGFSNGLSWPLSAEIPSSRLRVLTLSFATGVNYFCAWLISYCSPYFINPKSLNWGGRYCWIWAASNAITFVFFYFMLAEIKGRSLEEIDELFQKGISVRDFPKYECESSTRAHEVAVREVKRAEGTPVGSSEGEKSPEVELRSQTEV